MGTAISTVVSTALFLSATFATPVASAPQAAVSQPVVVSSSSGYMVPRQETLTNLSTQLYGDENYWTTLWNDNSGITDPDTVPAGTILQVRDVKPSQPEQLTEILADKYLIIANKKNQAYLKKIGYIRVKPVIASNEVAFGEAPMSITDSQLTFLGNCEAGMNPARNSGNGYYGAFQFSYGTWKSLNTGYERADLAPLDVQKAAVKQLLQRSSIHHQFPGCARKMRDAGLI